MLKNEWSSALDMLSIIDDKEMERRQKEVDLEEADRITRERMEQTEKALDAPVWWTLDNFNGSGCRCWIAGEKATLADCVDAVKTGASAILSCNKTGAGKSHLAIAIARAAAADGIRCTRYKDFTLFRLAEVERFRSNGGLRDAVQDAKKSGLLILDDVGKNALYRDGLQLTYYGNVLFDIVDRRAEKRLPTIITTRGEDRTELENVLGADFIRRVKMDERDKKTSVTIFLS